MTDKVIHLHSRLRRAFREINPPGIPMEMHAALSAEIRALESQVAITQATTQAGAMVQLAVARGIAEFMASGGATEDQAEEFGGMLLSMLSSAMVALLASGASVPAGPYVTREERRIASSHQERATA